MSWCQLPGFDDGISASACAAALAVIPLVGCSGGPPPDWAVKAEATVGIYTGSYTAEEGLGWENHFL
jgi:hypothetical protein